jgi:hypothetical protein
LQVRLTPWNGGALFLGGLAIGALLATSIFDTGESTVSYESIDPESGDVATNEDGLDGEIAITQEVAIISVQDTNSKPPENSTISPEKRPNTPPVYVQMLSPSYQSVSIEDLHFTFANQSRDDGWAFAVESEISQFVANNGVAEWAEIEYVECRKSICEIAGYLHGDTTHDAREIVDGISSATWWHSEKSVHLMESDRDGLQRFMVLVSGLSFENRVRQPRVVE